MTSRKRKVAFISCSGGGLVDAFVTLAAAGAVQAECVGIVTDRPCKCECAAVKHGIEWRRIIGADRTDTWSQRVQSTLAEWQAEIVVLLFLRKVGPAIWNNSQWKTWNLHPSLLPEFKGIGALEHNFESARSGLGSGWMGVTLHKVNDELDAGTILAQARYQVGEVETLERAEHASFLFKLLLLLACLERDADTQDASEQWRDRYRGVQPSELLLASVEKFAQPWAKGLLRGTLAGANS